jgi:hypothetical protein
MTTSLQAGGTDSLQLPPAKHVPVTRTDSRVTGTTTVTAPRTEGQVAAVRPSLGRAVAVPDSTAGPRAVAPAAAPGPKQPPAGRLDLVAEHSARVQIRLTRTTHPNFFETAFDRTARYAGVWVLDRKGTVVGAALELVGTNGNPPRRYTDSPTLLPAGVYTVYVVGDGPTGAHVPLQPGEKGLSATATRSVTASYATRSQTMGPAETSGSMRLRLPTSRSVGYGGGFIDNDGGAASTVDVCLPGRDGACTSGDPQSGGTQVIVDGSVGAAFDLTPDLLSEPRDVLLDADVQATGSTRLTCWWFTVALA